MSEVLLGAAKKKQKQNKKPKKGMAAYGNLNIVL